MLKLVLLCCQLLLCLLDRSIVVAPDPLADLQQDWKSSKILLQEKDRDEILSFPSVSFDNDGHITLVQLGEDCGRVSKELARLNFSESEHATKTVHLSYARLLRSLPRSEEAPLAFVSCSALHRLRQLMRKEGRSVVFTLEDGDEFRSSPFSLAYWFSRCRVPLKRFQTHQFLDFELHRFSLGTKCSIAPQLTDYLVEKSLNGSLGRRSTDIWFLHPYLWNAPINATSISERLWNQLSTVDCAWENSKGSLSADLGHAYYHLHIGTIVDILAHYNVSTSPVPSTPPQSLSFVVDRSLAEWNEKSVALPLQINTEALVYVYAFVLAQHLSYAQQLVAHWKSNCGLPFCSIFMRYRVLSIAAPQDVELSFHHTAPLRSVVLETMRLIDAETGQHDIIVMLNGLEALLAFAQPAIHAAHDLRFCPTSNPSSPSTNSAGFIPHLETTNVFCLRAPLTLPVVRGNKQDVNDGKVDLNVNMMIGVSEVLKHALFITLRSEEVVMASDVSASSTVVTEDNGQFKRHIKATMHTLQKSKGFHLIYIDEYDDLLQTQLAHDCLLCIDMEDRDDRNDDQCALVKGNCEVFTQMVSVNASSYPQPMHLLKLSDKIVQHFLHDHLVMEHHLHLDQHLFLQKTISETVSQEFASSTMRIYEHLIAQYQDPWPLSFINNVATIPAVYVAQQLQRITQTFEAFLHASLQVVTATSNNRQDRERWLKLVQQQESQLLQSVESMIGAARPFFAQGQWFWSIALLIRGQHQLWSLRGGLQTQLRKYLDFTPDSMNDDDERALWRWADDLWQQIMTIQADALATTLIEYTRSTTKILPRISYAERISSHALLVSWHRHLQRELAPTAASYDSSSNQSKNNCSNTDQKDGKDEDDDCNSSSALSKTTRKSLRGLQRAQLSVLAMLALESDTVWSSLRYGALSLVREEEEENQMGVSSQDTTYEVLRRMRAQWVEKDRETLRQSLRYMDTLNNQRDLHHIDNLESSLYAEDHSHSGCNSSTRCCKSSGKTDSTQTPPPRKVQTFFVSYGSELTEGLQALLDSAWLAGVPLHVVGVGQPYSDYSAIIFGLNTFFEATRLPRPPFSAQSPRDIDATTNRDDDSDSQNRHSNNLHHEHGDGAAAPPAAPYMHPDDVVVVVDAYDVLLYPAVRRIAHRLAHSPAPVLFCTEAYPYPEAALAFQYQHPGGFEEEEGEDEEEDVGIQSPDGIKSKDKFDHNQKKKKWSVSSLKFLNSGVLVGRVENVRQLFVDLLDEARLYRDDQQQIVRMYLTQPYRFALDTINLGDQDDEEVQKEEKIEKEAENDLENEVHLAKVVVDEVVDDSTSGQMSSRVGTRPKRPFSKGHVAMTAFKQVRYMARHFQQQSLTGDIYYTEDYASSSHYGQSSTTTKDTSSSRFQIRSRIEQSRFSSQSALLIFHGNNKQSNDLYHILTAYLTETINHFLVSTSLSIANGNTYFHDNDESAKDALRVREILLRLLWAYHDVNVREMHRLLRDELHPLLAMEGTTILKSDHNDTKRKGFAVKNFELSKFARDFIIFMEEELRTNYELLEAIDCSTEDT